MPNTEWHFVYNLGLLLCAAVVGGLLAQALRLPRVTAYLLVGLLLGPQVLERIEEKHLKHLHPFGELAMAMVLFNMGCHFTLVHFRKILRRVLKLSLGELGMTFVIVTSGMLLLCAVLDDPSVLSWKAALLLGTLALATAPATTILVLKENESEGPVTEYSTALVAMNNLACVVAFEIVLVTLHLYEGKLSESLHSEFWFLALDLAISLALGVIAGLLVSYACGLLSQRHWLVSILAMSTFLLGVCLQHHIPYLLTFLAMGVTVANASDLNKKIVAELDRITGLLCVVFFVIHGAQFDLEAMKTTGLIGAGYIVFRITGKYFGIFLFADSHHDGPQVRRWLGATLMSQAGAALALTAVLMYRDHTLWLQIQPVILGTVVFFEIAGPLLVRQAVLRSGEVPLAQAIRHTTTTPYDELKNLANRLLRAIGIDPLRGQSPEDLNVGHLMRTNVKGIEASAKFNELVAFIEHSHDNTFPVVGKENELVGVIRYESLRNELFDQDLGSLVCAADLAQTPSKLLYADDPLVRAWQKFQDQQDDSIPVVSREEPHRLLGLVNRRDLFRLYSKNMA